MKVDYPVETTCGGLTAVAAGKVASALGDLRRVEAAMNAIVYPGPDFSKLETDPDFLVASGQGEDFYTGVQGVIQALTTTDAIGALGKLDKGA